MNDEMMKYLVAAKSAIYDPEKARTYVPMLDTQQGAITAVGSVLGAIEQFRQIPPDIYPNLAVHIYLMMVDVAMGATGDKPSVDVMKQTIGALLQKVNGGK